MHFNGDSQCCRSERETERACSSSSSLKVVGKERERGGSDKKEAHQEQKVGIQPPQQGERFKYCRIPALLHVLSWPRVGDVLKNAAIYYAKEGPSLLTPPLFSFI